MQTTENKRPDSFLIAEFRDFFRTHPHFRTPCLRASSLSCSRLPGATVAPSVSARLLASSASHSSLATRHCFLNSNRQSPGLLEMSVSCRKQREGLISNRQCFALFTNYFVRSQTPAFRGPLITSQARQHNSLLRLVFSLFVFLRNFAALVRLEENHLAQSLIRVNSRRQRRRVADFQRDVPFPLRLERRHVHNDSAPRIRRFADANRQHLSRNPEIFHGLRERERIRRHDAHRPFEFHERARIKLLRIHDRRV